MANELWRHGRETYGAGIGMSRGETHLDQNLDSTRITIVQVVCIIYLQQIKCIILNILLPSLISQTQMLAVIPKLLFYLNTIINMIQLLIDHIVQQLNALPKLERRHTLFSSFLIIVLKLDVKSML